VTHVPNEPWTDLQEVTNRNHIAQEVIAGSAPDSASQIWQYVTDALADTPRLVAEVARLRGALDTARLDRANLAAAALATISAHREGEDDPLSYLRDELSAQGYEPRRRA
jgi:hypothetical protein